VRAADKPSEHARDFGRFLPHAAKPLGNTDVKPAKAWPSSAGRYPACSLHGAMNKVAPAPLWRCLNCNIGVELIDQPIHRRTEA
jgi:hypothetical protein